MGVHWEIDQYVRLIERILAEGQLRASRAGDTRSLFGTSLEVDLIKDGFPIVLGRKMYPKPVLGEMSAFLKGSTKVSEFKELGCNYWDGFADPDGTLRIDYGKSWRDFEGVDQLTETIKNLRHNPAGRTHVISGWRPNKLKDLALPCCHLLYQWSLRRYNGFAMDNQRMEGDVLDMIIYMRSVDVMIGLPSDLILAAAWNIVMAEEVGVRAGRVIFHMGDTHIYTNHMEATREYLRSAYLSFLPKQAVKLYTEEDNWYENLPKNMVFGDLPDAPKINFELNIGELS